MLFVLPMARLRFQIVALAGVAVLVSCGPGADGAGENAAVNAAAREIPRLPAAEPPLDREALLLAVARAASAAALGADDRDPQRELDGDQIELRLRFGCAGASETLEDGSRRWSFDQERRILRYRLGPDIAGDLPAFERVAGSEFEAVEGFWIRRPWLLAAACPANAPESPAEEPADDSERSRGPQARPQAAEQRIGIAQFFTKADTRTRRRDHRAYEATETLAPGEAPSAQGYNLVLSGRLKRLPNGRAIACAVESRDEAPACIVSAQFDRVWIERPEDGRTIAEWGGG